MRVKNVQKHWLRHHCVAKPLSMRASRPEALVQGDRLAVCAKKPNATRSQTLIEMTVMMTIEFAERHLRMHGSTGEPRSSAVGLTGVAARW